MNIEQKREEILHLLTETIRASEMRQGCTNHTYYAELLLKELSKLGVVIADESEELWVGVNDMDFHKTYPLVSKNK